VAGEPDQVQAGLAVPLGPGRRIGGNHQVAGEIALTMSKPSGTHPAVPRGAGIETSLPVTTLNIRSIWKYTYDERGNLRTSKDPFQDPDITTYEYDVFGRPGKIVVPKDHKAIPPVMITIAAPVYDGNDNVKTSFDATGARTDYTYYNNDELITRLAPPDTNTTDRPKTTYIYDRRGNLSSVTEPNGNAAGAPPGSYTTSYGYDNINELTSVTDAAGDPDTIYGYDNVGNRKSVTDPLAHLTQARPLAGESQCRKWLAWDHA